jgi:hypothetical protein
MLVFLSSAFDRGGKMLCGDVALLLQGVATATSLGVETAAKGEKWSKFLNPVALIAP